MVETSLHPRPCFYTLLRSDNPGGGDNLTYYDYQRALRSKKVELLQQKRSKSYEPGYRKPGVMHPGTRKIFTLKRSPGGILRATPQEKTESISVLECANGKINKSSPSEKENTVTNLEVIDLTQRKSHISPSSAIESMTEAAPPTQVQTERLPEIARKPRLVKSATARERQLSFPSSVITPPPLPQRPKTVASLRDSAVQTAMQGIQTESLPLQGNPLVINKEHRRAQSEGSHNRRILEEKENMCNSFQWSTTTQRCNDEVAWPEKSLVLKAFLPTTTVEQFPDPVSQRLTFRRYNSEPAGWQSFGTEWDYVQTRPCDSYLKGPQAMSYCSNSKNIQQIPGYSGYIPGLAMYEDPVTNTGPSVLIRTTQPRKTTISRRANIPGYAGQAHWAQKAPTHSNMPIPEPTSSARVHRMIPLEDELSPFRREGVFSRMITTVSPHNPYNKILY